MKIQKLLLASVITVVCGTALNASAIDFGALKGGNSGNVENEIKAFLKTADEAHSLTSKSAFVLGQALLTKAEMQANEDALAAASKIPDDKEREAAKAKVELDLQAQLSKVNYEAKADELAKANDKKKNGLIGASIYNFALGLLKDKELAGKGSTLVSSVTSNPMMLTKIGPVKDVVASISGQMGNMGKIAAGLQKMSTRIKSVPLPTSASAEAVAAAD